MFQTTRRTDSPDCLDQVIESAHVRIVHTQEDGPNRREWIWLLIAQHLVHPDLLKPSPPVLHGIRLLIEQAAVSTSVLRCGSGAPVRHRPQASTTGQGRLRASEENDGPRGTG